MPLPYAVKSSRWVLNKDYSRFLLLVEECNGAISSESRFSVLPDAKRSYITVEFTDVADFNYFDRVACMLFDTEKPVIKLTWFQRLVKRLKNLI